MGFDGAAVGWFTVTSLVEIWLRVTVNAAGEPPVACAAAMMDPGVGGHRPPFHPARRAPSPDVSGNQPNLKGPSCLKRQRGQSSIKTWIEIRQNGLSQTVHSQNGGLSTMCLLTESGYLVAPDAQLGQLNSISPQTLILPLMKTLQVGHSHGARSAPSSSSSWSHLSVSAMMSFRAPAGVDPASPVCEGTPRRPGTAVYGGFGQRTEGRPSSVRWQPLVMPASRSTGSPRRHVGSR